ncbi:MAG TPA: GAF domain-containing SpoIIE family protein phosphatase [Balneolaceae bacterium]|nr:GAF domain-containing SpoIIE family protein phosphatase [Balneolaceae bacterium]
MPDVDYLTKENRQLQLAVNELRILNDIATTITSTQPVEVVIDQIVIRCIKYLGVQEGTISLLERENSDEQFHTMIRHVDSSIERVPIKLDNRLKGWMLKNRKVLLSNDIHTDSRFHYLSDYAFQSILCVPLLAKGNLIGYLAVFDKKDGLPFTDQDRRLLSIIGSQSAQVIENARLYEEEKALYSLQEEMRMARDIQLSLLPDRPPEIPGFQISATNIPAKFVGGDYYDFLSLTSNKLGFCVGDITGKGMPAAMLMANLQATLRSQVMIFEDCCTCLKGTNKQLYRNTESTKFATLFYGILNPESGMLEYANGGHDTPILFRDKNQDPEFLNSTGLLLGVMDNVEYEMESTTLETNDVLFLFTDGITEAMNPEQQEFGLDRLACLVGKNRNKTADQIKETVLQEVRTYASQAPQSDDITIMVIKRN